MLKNSVSRLNAKFRVNKPFKSIKTEKFSYSRPSWSAPKLQQVTGNIHNHLSSSVVQDAFQEKATSAISYFDGSGKQIRPYLILALGRFLESHRGISDGSESEILKNIEKIAMVSEMLHNASLMHDDVLDEAFTRRNKRTLNGEFGDKNAVLIGNFVVGEAMRILASIGSNQCIDSVQRSMTDLIEGELLQIAGKSSDSSSSNTDSRLDLEIYAEKSYLKTGSLMANSLKAAAQVSQPENKALHEHVFNFGKSLGIAFQIIDDCLDFASNEAETGKPSQGADIKLGLITAPVIFASRSHPKVKKYVEMDFKETPKSSTISEKFVSETIAIVKRSDALPQSYRLAEIYAADAIFHLRQCCPLVENQDTSEIEDEIKFILSRNK